MEGTILYEIRCPNKTWVGNSDNKHCRNLCGKVNALTMGEFHCRKCKITYNFTVNEDGTVEYFYEPAKPKRRYDKLSPEDKLIDLINGE